MADYRCALVQFARANALGLQTISGIADAAGAFTPKTVLLWTTQQAADGFDTSGSPGAAHLSLFLTNPGQGGIFTRGWSSSMLHNSINFRAAMDALFAVSSFWDSLSQANNVAVLDSAASGQFVLDWTVIDASRPCLINALVLGGADFSCRVGSITKTAPGNASATGFGFQPKGAFGMAVATVRDIQTYAPGVSVDNLPALGWTDGSTQGASCCSGIATNAGRRQLTTRTALMHNVVNSNYRSEVQHVSFDPDGLTWNWLTAVGFPGNAYGDPGAYFAAFGGALPCACGVITQPAAPGTQSIAMSGRPGAVLFLSYGAASGTSLLTGKQCSFGGVDQVGHQFSSWMGGRIAGNGNNIALRAQDSTRAITLATPDFAATPPATPTATLGGTANAVITATGCDVIWTVCDGTAREVLWFAFGVAVATPEICVPSTTVTHATGGGGSAGSANHIPLGAAGNTPGAVVD